MGGVHEAQRRTRHESRRMGDIESVHPKANEASWEVTGRGGRNQGPSPHPEGRPDNTMGDAKQAAQIWARLWVLLFPELWFKLR